MARKSRRQSGTGIHKAENVAFAAGAIGLRTAAYVRLSIEDESCESIESQLDMIRQYVDDSEDLCLSEVYIDNGYTGTNFDRPEFNRMLVDVRTGKIQCIVVKDLSRFGRDFLETGYYIETLLPKLNVRLIAVNDRFDSSRESDMRNIAIPITNMVNEMYAKDISRKISAYNEHQRKTGQVKILQSVYGYSVDKENNVYVVNEETAPYVQIIFHWFLKGMGSPEIAKRLKILGIMTPIEYKSAFETHQKLVDHSPWNPTKVRDILHRETYLGNRAVGTRLTALYKNQKKEQRVPKDEWIVYEGVHQPLVSKKDFDETSRILNERLIKSREGMKRGKEINGDDKDIFYGLVYCGNCGRRMLIEHHRDRVGRNQMGTAKYRCALKSQYFGCNNIVFADFLRVIVMDQLKTLFKAAAQIKGSFETHPEDNPLAKRISDIQKKVQAFKVSKDNVNDRQLKLYEDYKSGILELDDYRLLKDRFNSEEQRVTSQIESAEQELADMHKKHSLLKESFDITNLYKGNIELSYNLLHSLIEKIIIHSDKDIEIVFKFQDVYEEVMSAFEEEMN